MNTHRTIRAATLATVRSFAETYDPSDPEAAAGVLEWLSRELLMLADDARAIDAEARQSLNSDLPEFPRDVAGDLRRYGLIYADPPWEYEDKAKAGDRGAEAQYPCLSVDELAQLPVPDIARDDCLLAMWWTPPQMREALELVDAWGFRLITAKGFTWHKLTVHGKSHFGMGHWTRANTEDCLLARRGRPVRLDAGVPQFLQTYRSKQHSRKPHEARLRLRRLIGDDVPAIELFARQAAPGWDAWGNEAPLPSIDFQEDDVMHDTSNRRDVFQVSAYERTAGILTVLAAYLRSPRQAQGGQLGKLLREFQDEWIKGRTPDEHGNAADVLNEALLAAIHRLASQARDGSLLEAEQITPEVHEMIARIQSKYEDDDPHEPRA